MSASDTFSSAKEFAARLRSLREKRCDQKLTLRDQVVRKPLSRLERQTIFKKTAGRWFYGTEEFQWILKLGVWLRTQIEKETALGRLAAKAFCSYDCTRAGRRIKNTEPDGARGPQPADSLPDKSNVRGAWLSSLTLSVRGIPRAT